MARAAIALIALALLTGCTYARVGEFTYVSVFKEPSLAAEFGDDGKIKSVTYQNPSGSIPLSEVAKYVR